MFQIAIITFAIITFVAHAKYQKRSLAKRMPTTLKKTDAQVTG